MELVCTYPLPPIDDIMVSGRPLQCSRSRNVRHPAVRGHVLERLDDKTSHVHGAQSLHIWVPTVRDGGHESHCATSLAMECRSRDSLGVVCEEFG
jgi:hypothetical protein